MLFSLSPHRLSPAARRSRLIRLAGVTVPLATAELYNRGYEIAWLVCPLRSMTGIPCPTCGMTRSLMAVVRGDWATAIHYHAFGLLLGLLLLVAILHWLLELRMGRQIQTIYGQWLRDRRWQIGFVASFLLYYAVRLSSWGASGELLHAVQVAPIGRILF